MKVDNAINYMILDMLRNILGMAENSSELGKYVTTQIRELIGCKMVILLVHPDNHGDPHNLIGICPERAANTFDIEFWEEVAAASHSFHSAVLLSHQNSGIRLEQLFSKLEGNHSIILPLEYSSKRVGLIVIVNIFDVHNLQTVIDSLDALAGVLAIELRNASLFKHMEEMVARRTKELTESEKRFRSIIEQATDAMFLSDMQGNIVDTNLQACKSLGYSREELLKLNIVDIDHLHDTEEKIIGAFQNYSPGESQIFESYHRKKNGEYFPVEVCSSLISFDNKSYVLGFARNISERKQTEQQIRRMGKHYQALIEKAPDGVVLIDSEGKFKFISPSAEKIFGYPKNGLLGEKPSPFVHPDDLPEVLATFQQIIEMPSIVPTIQYRFRSGDGQWRWVESTFSNLISDESVEAIVVNFREITDRKVAEEEIRKLNEDLEQKIAERTLELENRSRELMDNKTALLNLVEDLNIKSDELLLSTKKLEAANKELEAFSYSVSHDLRSPLRAISGFVRILLDDYEHLLDDEGKRICNIIQTNAIKMGQLIDDLLSFSRLIRSELHHTHIDMNSMVQTSIQELGSNYNLESYSFSIEDLPSASGDANMIKQVWINLISNALKYSSKSKKPKIEIGIKPESGPTIYFIRDNGVGFNMEYAHKMFGVFQRLHSANEFEGTGVGLAIVQRIINRHQGRVWAESELEKGAVFYFTLSDNHLMQKD